MEINDSYRSILEPSTGEFKDRGSKFLAFAWPVESEEHFHAHLDNLKKEHPKARHHCYAYRLGMDLNLFRANDDGEPGGTAGKPILGQIDSFALTNTGIVVVRYFGGTLLGTSGLINAYRSSARAALETAVVIEKYIVQEIDLSCNYEQLSGVLNALNKFEHHILKQEYTDMGACLLFSVRKRFLPDILLHVRAHAGKISLEEAAVKLNIEGLDIKI